MQSMWESDIRWLLDRELFSTVPKTVQCPFCLCDFVPRQKSSPRHEFFHRQQVFCSATCYKLWREDRKAEREREGGAE